MTESQKIRYRELLAKKKLGEKVDLKEFVKEVQEEKSKQTQYNQKWLDSLSGSFTMIENVIEHKRKELWKEIESSSSDNYRKLLDEFRDFVVKQYQSIGE